MRNNQKSVQDTILHFLCCSDENVQPLDDSNYVRELNGLVVAEPEKFTGFAVPDSYRQQIRQIIRQPFRYIAVIGHSVNNKR